MTEGVADTHGEKEMAEISSNMQYPDYRCTEDEDYTKTQKVQEGQRSRNNFRRCREAKQMNSKGKRGEKQSCELPEKGLCAAGCVCEEGATVLHLFLLYLLHITVTSHEACVNKFDL